MTRPRLIITRGLPGSGKTTRAKAWVADDPVHRARVNRDDLRGMIHDGVYLKGGTEHVILRARNTLIRALLERGLAVVCDDTNLPNRVVRDLRRQAALTGADFEVWDMTDVPLETCVFRDDLRINPVGEKVITDFYNRFIKGKTYPLPLPDDETSAGDPIEPYAARPDTPRAIIVDIDGTMALMAGRSPYDESRVHEDRPNEPVIAAVYAMYAHDHRVIFVSGRTDACRTATEVWLAQHVPVRPEALFMRKAGDTRKDSVVKLEIFDRFIRDHYHVRAVFDDRNQVVEMWRNLGLTVFQVADGNF